MLSLIFDILAGLGCGLVAGLLTTLFRLTLTLLAFTIFGERHFVEADATDGCSYCVNSGVISFLAVGLMPVFEKARAHAHHQQSHFTYWPWALWIVLAVSIGFAVCSVIGLWMLGVGHRKWEFAIRDGAVIRRRDRVRLLPTFVAQERDYINTALACWYGLYSLTLHDSSGPLARNVYLSEAEMQQDIQAVLKAVPECRAFSSDLTVAWQESPIRLHVVYLDHVWVGLLCGPLTDVSSDCRSWWRQWLLPDFPEDGLALVPVSEFSERFEELCRGYADEIAASQPLHDNVLGLQELMRRANDTIQLMPRKRYGQFEESLRGDGMWRCRFENGISVKEVQPVTRLTSPLL